MANTFLDSLGALLEKPHVVDALNVLGGNTDFPISGNLDIPFGLTFEQSQQVRQAAVGQDVAAAQINESKQRARAEAERIALERRKAGLEERKLEHEIKSNDLSESEALALTEEANLRASAVDRQFRERTLDKEIGAQQAMERDRIAASSAELDRKLASDERQHAESMAVQRAEIGAATTYRNQMYELQKQQNAMEFAQLEIQKLKAEADAERAITGRIVPNPDRIAKWTDLAASLQDNIPELDPQTNTPEDVLKNTADKKMAATAVYVYAYQLGEMPLDLFISDLPPSIREKFLRYDEAAKRGDPTEMEALKKEAIDDFNKALTRQQEAIAEAATGKDVGLPGLSSSTVPKLNERGKSMGRAIGASYMDENEEYSKDAAEDKASREKAMKANATGVALSFRP